MDDADPLNLLALPEPPRPAARTLNEVPAPEWHALSWRPAGSMSLGERWLRAGQARPESLPPKLKRRR